MSENRSVFSVLSMSKYIPGETNDKFITSRSFLSKCAMISKRKRRVTVYGFGRSLWSAIGRQRKLVDLLGTLTLTVSTVKVEVIEQAF